MSQVRDDLPRGALVISRITGDGGRLSMEAKTNCIGVAAQATLELLGVSPGGKGTHKGIALSLEKGLPLGSGLGSSAASAAAAAVAVGAHRGRSTARYGLVQHSPVQYSAVQYGTVQSRRVDAALKKGTRQKTSLSLEEGLPWGVGLSL